MTKIRCQVCGGENLHSESATKIVCEDCGNLSYVIPSEAVVSLDNPLDENIVTIRFDRTKTDCPRRSICLNDIAGPNGEQCQVCNVVKHNYDNINRQLVELYELRNAFLESHPELEDFEE